MYCGKPCIFGTIFKGPDKYFVYRADLALWAGLSDGELLIIHSLRICQWSRSCNPGQISDCELLIIHSFRICQWSRSCNPAQISDCELLIIHSLRIRLFYSLSKGGSLPPLVKLLIIDNSQFEKGG